MIFMRISVEKINKVKQEYSEFKKTSGYEERKNQLMFCDFASSIINKLLQKKSISNENLTSLIQIFGHGSSSEKVKKYINLLDFEKSYSDEIFNKFIALDQTGFTSIGKAAITGLTDQQLQIAHKFLTDVASSDSEKTIREVVSDFEDNSVPQVKDGVYSPWLYYLHPEICPIVAGPVKGYLKKLGFDYKSYLDAWNLLKQINLSIGEKDYGFIDEFIWENSSNYWVFIIPKDFEEGKLWEYCRQNSIAAMQYQEGLEEQKAVTSNISKIKKIKLGDKVIVYINDNTIGGIGEVSKKFYEDTSRENGFNGRFGQRIGLKWITTNFEIDIKRIKPNLKEFPRNLSLKTIHEISDRDFNTIYKFVDEGIIVDEGTVDTKRETDEYTRMEKLLSNKKQIILYGPPGTGKTFIAYNFIRSNRTDQIYSKKTSFDRNFFWFTARSDRRDSEKLWSEPDNGQEVELSYGRIKSAYQKITVGDILFIYVTSPIKQIIGTAECIRKEVKNNDIPVVVVKGLKRIEGPKWKDLKSDDILSESKVVKAGAMGTLFLLNENEASRILDRSNISLEDLKIEKLVETEIVKNHEFITFHPSYSYEDFIEGLRPLNNDDGQISYEVDEGLFKKFSRSAFNALMAKVEIEKEWSPMESVPQLTKEEKEKAKKATEEVPFYLVIDEINRGDMSRIFGELITVLESDKRLTSANELITTLPYSKTKFAVPPNLYLIGTMNTADKSIALIDVALRRRFGFIEMMPDYSVLEELLVSDDEGIREIFNLAISALKTVNENILKTYDRDHQIGHSYLLKLRDSVSRNDAVENFRFIWNYEVFPLMQEYFYDAPAKLKQVMGNEFIIVENRSFSYIDKLEGEEFINAIKKMVNSDKRQNEIGD